jgi:hypothetical protein
LADLFLKRALALLAVVAIAFVAVATFGDSSAAFAAFIEHDPRQFALLLTLVGRDGAMYPSLRSVLAWFVDTVLLRGQTTALFAKAWVAPCRRSTIAEAVLGDARRRDRAGVELARVTWESDRRRDRNGRAARDDRQRRGDTRDGADRRNAAISSSQSRR